MKKAFQVLEIPNIYNYITLYYHSPATSINMICAQSNNQKQED